MVGFPGRTLAWRGGSQLRGGKWLKIGTAQYNPKCGCDNDKHRDLSSNSIRQNPDIVLSSSSLLMRIIVSQRTPDYCVISKVNATLFVIALRMFAMA